MCVKGGGFIHEKKKEILLFQTTWMDLESIMLSEISQKEKDKYNIISLIHRTYKTKQTNRNRLTNTENKLIIGRGELVWGLEK